MANPVLEGAAKDAVVNRIVACVSNDMSLNAACKQVAAELATEGTAISARTLARWAAAAVDSSTHDKRLEKAHQARIGVGVDALQERGYRLQRLQEAAIARLELQQAAYELELAKPADDRDEDVRPPTDVAIKRAAETTAALARLDAALFDRGARLNPDKDKPAAEAPEDGAPPARSAGSLIDATRKFMERSGA